LKSGVLRFELVRSGGAAGSFRESFANFVGEPQDTVARCSGKCERCCVYIGAVSMILLQRGAARSRSSWIRVWYGLDRFAARRRRRASSGGAMRMAMSCLALPVLGRPTRRARLSSASVDCGISEKSMRRSEICLAFFAAGLARADDANGFFAMIDIPHSIDNYQDAARGREPQPLTTHLSIGVIRIGPVERVRIAEYCRSFFERDTVLREIRDSFRGIPREHITVYTLISPQNQDAASSERPGAGLRPAPADAAEARSKVKSRRDADATKTGRHRMSTPGQAGAQQAAPLPRLTPEIDRRNRAQRGKPRPARFGDSH
jgi:hypothetical protein